MKFNIHVVAILLLLLFACKKETLDAPPSTAMFNIDLNEYPKLYGMENYLLCPDALYSKQGIWGRAGIIVYYSAVAGYVAYDRCCRYSECENRNEKVIPDGMGFAQCPSCSSRYNLSIGDGQVATGPANKSLWVYPGLAKRGSILSLSYSPSR